jgi:predicted CoA-substrate-specific enzyme activase
MKYYIGIDVGSVSMKGVVIDQNNNIIKSNYLKNHGLTETIKDLIISLEVQGEISGVGITGSGKEFISHIIGGDIVESEIIAHYTGVINLHPKVKTIFDIGGEDSKLIIVDNGNLSNFSMNCDCGGGTGSMIESIGNRMGIKVEDIGDLALKSKEHIIIPSKCGIFAQSSVVSKINKGVPKEDILMGVCRGLIGNYFTMLAKGVKILPPYVFDGATAKNKALVKCFEDELKGKIIVPESPELMGAIGMAIIVKEDFKGKTRFNGFDIKDNSFETETFYAKGCTNECEITRIKKDGQVIGYINNKCEKCIKNG